MTRKTWVYAITHILILSIVAAGLIALFAPTARLAQSMVGELTMPDHVSSYEERENWEKWIERGYGEGVNTVMSILFFIKGMFIPGIVLTQLIIPHAMKSDPEMEPSDLVIPTGVKSTAIAVLVLVIVVILASTLYDGEMAGTFLAFGFSSAGLLLLPFLALAVISMYTGVSLWKRMNWKDDNIDDDISNFYRNRTNP